MSADKVLYLEITKVSQDIIRAWKNPKKLKWTTHNQFKRCAQYYVETSIDTVLPLIKNIEQFSYLEQPKPKKANLVNNGKKTMMDEAREFLGNVELTTRTRGQRRKMYNEDGIAQSTSSICSQVSQTTKRKISLSLEHEVYPVKTNVRRNTHFSPNYPESNNTGYNDLSIPSSMNTDIIGKSVKSMQTSSKTCESRAKHSASKMCTSPLKAIKTESQTLNSDEITRNNLDMPELSDFLSCQEIMLTNPNSRPKLVLKINRLSDHYQAFSDVEEKATTNVPESSEKSSLDNNVDTGVGIGYKDIEIIKQSRNKRTAKAVGNKSKTKKAGKGVNASGKVTKAKIMKPLPKPARNLFSCSDASDTDDHLEKAEIKPPCRKFSVCDESKPSITKKAVKVTKAKADRNLSIISDPTCNDVLMAKAIKLDSEPSSVTKNAGSDVDASGKKTKPKIIKPRPKPARNLSILYDTVTVNSDSKLAKAQINQKSKTSSVTKKAGSVVDSNGKKNKAKIIKRRQKPALDLFNCSDTSDSDNQLAKSQMNVTTSSDFGNSKISFGDLSEKDSDSNNEVSLSVKDKVINMNGEVVSKIIHESNNMNNECASSSVKIKSSIDECNNEVSNDLAENIEECSSNVTNKSIDNKCIIKESNNAETDDSDVISLCADEDFNEDFDFEETTTIAPKKVTNPTPLPIKKVFSSSSKLATTAWSASLDDCKMTIRRDSVSGTPNCSKNDDVTRNFNKNTKTIVKNMPSIPLIPNRQQTLMLRQVFQGLCVEFVNDNCKKTCSQSHEYPSVDIVRQNIKKVNLTIIETAYEFMKNHIKMFLMYFPLFCEIFSFFKLPNQLKSMFKDCERHARTIDYYRHVVAGLTNLGILKYKSIRMCIESATDSPYARETITSMIAETGPDVVRFVDYLTRCGALPIPLFNKIMEHCVTYQNPDLQYYLFNSFQNVLQHSTVSSQVNVTSLIKLIGLIKRSQEFNNAQTDGLLNVLQNFCSI